MHLALKAGSFLALVALIPACGSSGGAVYQAPATQPGDDGWEVYVDAVALTPANAATVGVGHDTPEAAVMAFFASRMRGDDAWKRTIETPPSERMTRKLAKYEAWTFRSVKLDSRKRSGEGRYWITVEMTIEVRGKSDSGKDQAEAVLIDGKWWVRSVPT